ncbi:MAG: hypothetical protein AAFW87_11315 [Pseudomonadota bacterium]
MDLLISLIAGAIGGNIAAGASKNHNLGLLINSVVGLVGGGLGGQALWWIGAGGLAQSTTAGGALDPAALMGQVAASAIGGGAALVATGMMRNLLTR